MLCIGNYSRISVHSFSMLMTFPLDLNTVRETHPLVVILAFFVPFVGGILLFFYKTRHARLWRKGVFPPRLKPTEDNFLEAYLALGAKMMILDYHASKRKVRFINAYFSRYFKFANYNFSDSLVFSFRYPIKTETVTNWMKKHIPTEGGRSQIVYFLAGLGMVSGSLSQQELHFLKKINSELELDAKHLVHILSIYASYSKSKEERSKDQKKSVNQTKSYAYDILGLSSSADNLEIKKAYRQLVKIHHPDNFVNASPSQIKMAEEKFIEIQKAYDVLNR